MLYLEHSLFLFLGNPRALFCNLFIYRRHSVALHSVKTLLGLARVEHIVIGVRFAVQIYGRAAGNAILCARQIFSSANRANGLAHNGKNTSAACAVSAARAVFCAAYGTNGFVVFNYVRSAFNTKCLSLFYFVSANLTNEHIFAPIFVYVAYFTLSGLAVPLSVVNFSFTPT